MRINVLIISNELSIILNDLFGLILCGAFLYSLIRHCSRQAWNRVPPATNCCLLLTCKDSIDTSRKLLTGNAAMMCHASIGFVNDSRDASR